MKTLSKQVDHWIDELRPGWFSYAIFDARFNIKTPKQKTLRRVILFNLCSKGKLVKHPTETGVFLKRPPTIDWQECP